MNVSVLVPYGGLTDPWRDQARRYTIDRLRRLHAGWEIVEGRSAMPWSKGAAVHDAYLQASGDVLVIADADSFVSAEALERCVDQVADTHRWAMPHDLVFRLNEQSTVRVYGGWEPHRPKWPDLARPAYSGVIGGGIVVLHRDAYQQVGGIDPRYLGWGGEDLSFGWALLAVVGLPFRPRADLYHLWHPHALGDAAETLRGSVESEALVAEYRAARRDPKLMREVLARWTHAASST